MDLLEGRGDFWGFLRLVTAGKEGKVRSVSAERVSYRVREGKGARRHKEPFEGRVKLGQLGSGLGQPLDGQWIGRRSARALSSVSPPRSAGSCAARRSPGAGALR